MRILIAEDEPKTQHYLLQGMREVRFLVDAVGDGNAALALLREHCFDVVVLNVMLPGYDGWSIIKTLRTSRNLAHRQPLTQIPTPNHTQ